MATTTDLSARSARSVRSSGARHVHLIENWRSLPGDTVGAADIDNMLACPAGYLALLVGLQVLALEGAALTIDVGVTGVDADAFLDGTDINTGTPPVRYCSNVAYTDATDAGNVESAVATQLYGVLGGKFFTTADTIDILWNDASDTAVLRLSGLIINFDGNGSTV